MQAQLQVTRFPRLFAIVLFAAAAAMLLGGALGYTLRSAVAGSPVSQYHATVQQQGTTGSLADRHGSAGNGSSEAASNDHSAPRIGGQLY